MPIVLAESDVVLDIKAPLLLSIEGKARHYFLNFVSSYRENKTETCKGQYQFDLYKKDNEYLGVLNIEGGVTWDKFNNLLEVADCHSFLLYEAAFLHLLFEETGFKNERLLFVSTGQEIDMNAVKLVFKTEQGTSNSKPVKYVLADYTVVPREHHSFGTQDNDNWILTFTEAKNETAFLTVDSVSFEVKRPVVDVEQAKNAIFANHLGHTFAVQYGLLKVEPKPQEQPFKHIDEEVLKADGEPTHKFFYRHEQAKEEGFINVWGDLLLDPIETETHTYMLFGSLSGDKLAALVLNKNNDGSINYGIAQAHQSLSGKITGFADAFIVHVRKLLSDYLVSKGFEPDAELYGLANLSELAPENYTKIDSLGNTYIFGKKIASFKNRNKEFMLFENVTKIESAFYFKEKYRCAIIEEKWQEINLYQGFGYALNSVASKNMSAERNQAFNEVRDTMIELGLLKVVSF